MPKLLAPMPSKASGRFCAPRLATACFVSMVTFAFDRNTGQSLSMCRSKKRSRSQDDVQWPGGRVQAPRYSDQLPGIRHYASLRDGSRRASTRTVYARDRQLPEDPPPPVVQIQATRVCFMSCEPSEDAQKRGPLSIVADRQWLRRDERQGWLSYVKARAANSSDQVGQAAQARRKDPASTMEQSFPLPLITCMVMDRDPVPRELATVRRKVCQEAFPGDRSLFTRRRAARVAWVAIAGQI